MLFIKYINWVQLVGIQIYNNTRSLRCNYSYERTYFCTAFGNNGRNPLVRKFCCAVWNLGPGGSVGIATRYGMDGPGIVSRWGEIFRTRPDRLWGSTQPPVRWVLGRSRGYSSRGVALTTHLISAEVKERVELYLCSHSGSLWPVLGWPLSLPLPLVWST